MSSRNNSFHEAPSAPIRFGAFIAPFHPLEGNPTLQLRRDLELAELLDELGFDEVWFGEHHSTGVELIMSPEVMIAAAGERTKRIRLGTGVSSVCYHNPLILANRILQLDHMTQGRVMMGIGPGQLPSDAFMMGIEPRKQRDMMAEAIEALVPLLRGETVTLKTDWFDLREAQSQLRPFNPNGIPVAVGSVFSPTGVTLAGRHGLGVLSLAAGDQRAANGLAAAWATHEKVAADHGHVAERESWRVVNQIHLSTSTSRAREDLEFGVLRTTRFLETFSDTELPWRSTPHSAIEEWTTNGLPSWGKIIAGTPQDAIHRIEELVDKSGGFGTFLYSIADCAPWDATKRSLELFAEYVMPHFKRANANRESSLAWAHSNRALHLGEMAAAIDEATNKYSHSSSHSS
ncbi:LLM class flavin-dependent oxidoreductase [Mycolicibacterium goodii]|uniref:Monooxygenase n=1 Tax=Mycolicibacterium goodii TaxID=134601 RepID=A0A0K0X447_MYCGD|nr:monooxygenase [Mycolicibacterium goodii]